MDGEAIQQFVVSRPWFDACRTSEFIGYPDSKVLGRMNVKMISLSLFSLHNTRQRRNAGALFRTETPFFDSDMSLRQNAWVLTVFNLKLVHAV